MFTINNRELQIDYLLDKMAESVQLDPTRQQKMKDTYEAVSDWIEKDEVFFQPYKYEVYPHGSVRILTTVKPIGKDEFDLDVAIHLKSEYANHTPEKIYKELQRRRNEHATYKKMLEPKNRCLRLNYAGDFHMDLLPGVQEELNDPNKLRVPDKELGTWVSSNPRGYADWFINRANTVKSSILEKAIRAENLPADDFKNKTPLQRAVQLIKRYRDLYFEKDGTYKTSSIVLTTLAGHFYNGEDSIFNAVDGIITRIQTTINGIPNRIKVLNPMNEAEDFTEKWEDEPEYYKAFQEFCSHLYAEWQKLKGNNDLLTEGKVMKGLFGDDLYIRAQTEQVQATENARRSNSLYTNRTTGVLTTAALLTESQKVKPNTFYGE